MIDTALYGQAYTEDAEYLEMWSQPRRVVAYDWRTRRYVEMLVRGPRTPRDTVTQAKPDEMIEQVEPWGGLTKQDAARLANQASRASAVSRHAALRARIVTYLQANGPTSVHVLADACGLKVSHVSRHLSMHKGSVYCVVGGGRGRKWGLAGVHDAST